MPQLTNSTLTLTRLTFAKQTFTILILAGLQINLALLPAAATQPPAIGTSYKTSPQNTSDSAPDNTPNNTSNNTSNNTPNNTSNNTPNNTSKNTANNTYKVNPYTASPQTSQHSIPHPIQSSITPPIQSSITHPIKHAIQRPIQEQRNNFLAAERALKKNQLKNYQRLHEQLGDYPLAPYVEYKALNRRLYSLPYAEVDTFLNQHANSYLGDRLLQSWLFRLAKKKRWHEYQSYYNSDLQHRIDNVTLQCYYLRARLYNGEKTALDDVLPLWNSGNSRPKACDPLFKHWIKAGWLRDDIVWDRHRKALENRKLSLALYVSRYFKNPLLNKRAEQYRAVYQRPSRILKTHRYQNQDPETKEIILYGIKRSARKNLTGSLAAWQRYDAQQLFSDADRLDMQEFLSLKLAKRGDMKRAEALLAGQSASDDTLIERLVRASLQQQDWLKTRYWITRLSNKAQMSERWRYWTARTTAATDNSLAATEKVQSIYANLALSRGFYGFLAADILGRNYKLVDRPVSPKPELMLRLQQLPGMKRAREFLALKRINAARREWLYTTRNFGQIEMKAAGVMAQQWGWHRKGIQAMASARYWDDLGVRFPLAFQSQVEITANATQVEPHLLFAVARQESAFSPDARSRVGATGLMQLMPSTARATARKIGVKYQRKNLLQPAANIELGGSYLNQLLNRFDGNRILAAAAYNAGPHRVNKWLNKNAEGQLPYDIWIETIPFKETRHYVQNILAYSVIYGYRLGVEKPFIREREAHRLL